MTCPKQTRPRATSDPTEEQYDNGNRGRPEPSEVTAYQNHNDNNLSRSSSGSSKRSFDDDLERADSGIGRFFKKKRIAPREFTGHDEVYENGTGAVNTDKHDGGRAEEERFLYGPPSHSSWSDDGYCRHDRFDKHNGVSSHGLWPHGAMICECGDKIIGVRGTDMPCVGRGDFGHC